MGFQFKFDQLNYTNFHCVNVLIKTSSTKFPILNDQDVQVQLVAQVNYFTEVLKQTPGNLQDLK
jgi:hypothetical protein